MTKRILNLRNVATIVACLAAMTVFSGCGSKEEPRSITVPIVAHWAVAEDFADCQVRQFSSNGKILTVYNAQETQAKTQNTAYSAFSVKQVDFVKNGANNPANIIGTATFQGLGADLGQENNADYGTDANGAIPLFTLTAAENSNAVLSVSRQNDLVTQSSQDGGYANKLEARAYGEYWDYTGAGNAYVSHKAASGSADYVKYTSLQKFAVWIDKNGNMTLYPAATYLWKYGDNKTTQSDIVVPNAVLVYNDINVKYTAVVSSNIDKANGLQIGQWSGQLTGSAVPSYTATVPNNLENFSDYTVLPFKTVIIDNGMRFYDLEKDGKFNLSKKIAILEYPFADRTITYIVSGDNTTPKPVSRGGRHIGYQTFLNQIGSDLSKAEYLTVYKENERIMTKDHIIPYYSFSITYNGTEYFLNIDRAGANPNRKDSVYWTSLFDAATKVKLLDWKHNENFLPTYKFCLPCGLKQDGSFADPVQIGAVKYPPVYLQTLDCAADDIPFLVFAGAATKYVTTNNLWNAMDPRKVASTLKWGVYSVDYRNIDPQNVATWVFKNEY